MECPVSPGTICLIDDDDDDDDDDESTNGEEGTRQALAIIIDSDSDDDGGGKMPTTNYDYQSKYDDVMIVDPTDADVTMFDASLATGTARINTTAGTSVNDDDDDDIQVIGDKNAMRLPHGRQDCVECKFVQDMRHKIGRAHSITSDGNAGNQKYCNLCYCFVCDILASKCKEWKSNHCHASDQGADGRHWKMQRSSRKVPKPSSSIAASITPSTPQRLQRQNLQFSEFMRRTYPLMFAKLGRDDSDDNDSDDNDSDVNALFNEIIRKPEPGPFIPTCKRARTDPSLTKCRKCGWYSKFEHKNYAGLGSSQAFGTARPKGKKQHPVGTMDWCHACGRVANKKDFGKEQSKPYKPLQGDISLGTREISFRIKAHDPRKIQPFDKNWTKYGGKSSKWTYNEGDTQEDFFNHRIGKHPTAPMILASIPISEDEEQIPEKARFRTVSHGACSSSPANETEALLLDNRRDMTIFQGLSMFSLKYSDELNPLPQTIKAKWDKHERKGTLTISLYIRSQYLNMSVKDRFLSDLMGAWYNVFPFKLSDLTNGRLIDSTVVRKSKSNVDHEQVANEERYNEEAKVISAAHSFKCSTGNGGGGVSENDNSLSGMLRRYYKEALVEDYSNPRHWYQISHRRKRTSDVHCQLYPYRSEYTKLGPAIYLNKEDLTLMTRDTSTTSLISPITSTLSSFGGLLQQLENLGHSAVDHIDGLNVELFDFQSQSVSWALERERLPGGIQNYLYAPLPQPTIYNGRCFKPTEVYFSPVLNQFKTDRPACVRGGVIATEMGLGKTMISLALVLQNPPPPLPESGSLVCDMNPNTCEWPLESVTEKRAQKKTEQRGSIFCRGTLVVCNVSLVGQWIDEAKSKLETPGLVHSYHGSNRIRNASALAKGAIVVTTYATLASDKFYHGKGRLDYCPPCEQIRWWRIICDESHALKNVNCNTSHAISNLCAVNKWAVTGTPMNTSLNDLNGQLKFVGLEHLPAMFRVFQEDMPSHFSSRKRTNTHNDCAARFLFVMRSILIRHSIKQQGRMSNIDIMSLPPKIERSILIKFTDSERKEYDKLETDAKSYYTTFKGNIGAGYLKLYSALMPLRIACSGGVVENEDDKGNDRESHEDNPPAERKKMKNIITDVPFKSKHNQLLQELEKIRSSEPESKSLVFSQFTSTLSWMKQELPKHGFQFRTLSGDMPMKKRATALREFQSDPRITIFLLSMRSGAVGINLTQANHIFLMEPATNPALEAQAIGRIYRMGQRKSVKVIRMYMAQSFETRLLGVLEKKYSSSRNKEKRSTLDIDGSESNASDTDTSSSDMLEPITSCTQVVGHMMKDKSDLVKDEFDTLFGVEAESLDLL